MLEYIKGILKSTTPNAVILETNGLGYKLFIPANAFSHLPTLEKPLILFISEIIREDAHHLYGFLNIESRDLFETFRNISGIGPKAALALVGHSPDISSLLMAIKSANVPFLSKVPGIGKKTAERLIVEMKDKVKNLTATSLPFEPNASIKEDGINALLNLGYSNTKATIAIQKVLTDQKDTPDLSTLIRQALKLI